MPKYYELIESRVQRARGMRDDNRLYQDLVESRRDHWRDAIAGSILVTLPVAGALYRGSFGWMELVVATVGIAALAAAAKGFMRARSRSFKEPRSTGRHTVCPRSGEPVLEEA